MKAQLVLPSLGPMTMRVIVLIAMSLLVSTAASCGTGDRARHVSLRLPTIDDDQPREYPGLHNVVAFADRKYSGSAPESEGFQTLASMGIRTIISVDGAEPDVDAAKLHGMRYVHLPIGYNGMDRERTLEVARAIRDLPGPVYVHCHHGKHRSAGALGAAAVTLGLTTSDTAMERMRVSGTAPAYTGLYQGVAAATVASSQELDAADDTFPQTWKASGLVKSMVEIEIAFEQLRAIEKAGWIAPRNHPDLVPVAEAGRLADLLRDLQDDERVKAKPEELTHWLVASSKLCEDLEEALAHHVADRAMLTAQFQSISQSCKDCHSKYRDQ